MLAPDLSRTQPILSPSADSSQLGPLDSQRRSPNHASISPQFGGGCPCSTTPGSTPEPPKTGATLLFDCTILQERGGGTLSSPLKPFFRQSPKRSIFTHAHNPFISYSIIPLTRPTCLLSLGLPPDAAAILSQWLPRSRSDRFFEGENEAACFPLRSPSSIHSLHSSPPR